MRQPSVRRGDPREQRRSGTRAPDARFPAQRPAREAAEGRRAAQGSAGGGRHPRADRPARRRLPRPGARDAAQLGPSTVSRAVATLVSHGLVERRPDPSDKRAHVLALTPDGRTALADTYDWYAGVLARALAGWTPDEVAAFNAALHRFTRDIEVALGNNDNLEAAR